MRDHLVKEITICLLPQETSVEIGHLARDFPNIPHISLFQMAIDAGNMDALCQDLKRLTFEEIPFYCTKISYLYGNTQILLEAKNPEHFVNFKKEVIASALRYRASQLLRQIDFLKLTPLQKEYVQNYGIYWGVGSFLGHAHLTLKYKDTTIPLTKINIPPCLTGKRLAIGFIGKQGNLYQVYKEIFI